MTVSLNHTIVVGRDKVQSAANPGSQLEQEISMDLVRFPFHRLESRLNLLVSQIGHCLRGRYDTKNNRVNQNGNSSGDIAPPPDFGWLLGGGGGGGGGTGSVTAISNVVTSDPPTESVALTEIEYCPTF